MIKIYAAAMICIIKTYIYPRVCVCVYMHILAVEGVPGVMERRCGPND